MSSGYLDTVSAEFAAARAHLEQGIALYDPQQHHTHAFRYGQDPGVCCRAYVRRDSVVLGLSRASLAAEPRGPDAWPRSWPTPSAWDRAGLAACLHQFRREARLTHERAEAAIRSRGRARVCHHW